MQWKNEILFIFVHTLCAFLNENNESLKFYLTA